MGEGSLQAFLNWSGGKWVAGRSCTWQCASVPQDHFDEAVAARYDLNEAERFAPAVLDPTVSFLAELAGGGPVLELGIGTGRVALPLSQRGIRVHGIELSPPMIDRLRAKPGSGAIEVTVGDFATTRVGRTFRLAYLVFNTIMNLTSQEEQVECFRNVADHLEAGGCFVIEVGVPQLQRLPPGETVRAFKLAPDHLGFDEYDVPSQRLVSHHYLFGEEGGEVRSFPFRYVWPAELDLMARLAGMSLRERWGGWGREPFTAGSSAHVSVWEMPAA
jgi:SAM-dependent methyltransferase